MYLIPLTAHEAISHAIKDVQESLETWVRRREQAREDLERAGERVEELSVALIKLKAALERGV